jgi:hypothetical protein
MCLVLSPLVTPEPPKFFVCSCHSHVISQKYGTYERKGSHSRHTREGRYILKKKSTRSAVHTNQKVKAIMDSKRMRKSKQSCIHNERGERERLGQALTLFSLVMSSISSVGRALMPSRPSTYRDSTCTILCVSSAIQDIDTVYTLIICIFCIHTCIHGCLHIKIQTAQSFV